jgi:2-polyprenyl-6-methoxyphenol hydroxylase-like FAD-dependent oxidoreductase
MRWKPPVLKQSNDVALMKRPRALIVGGSLGGLFAANLLRTVDWDVTVCERTSGDLAGRGVGLGTRDELFEALRRAGITIGDAIGVNVHSRICLNRDGTINCEVPIRTVTTAWDRLYRALKDALPAKFYRPGMQLKSFEQSDKKITALFADGSRDEADLLVAADGMNSTVRRQLMPELAPQYAGYVAWRGAVTENELSAAYHDLIFRHMNFCLPDGELAIAIPMPPSGDYGCGPRRSQFSWFCPVDRAVGLRNLCTDSTGYCHGESIPPPLIRHDVIEELRVHSKSVLAPQVAALVNETRQPVLQAIYDLESPQLVFGRVVLLGDAAFVARPHVGTGVTKAALDAQCLANVLRVASDDFGEALVRYDLERRQFGSSLVARGRYLGAYLSAQQKPIEHRSGAELDREPETFMREFGGAGVIEAMPASTWH